MRATGPARRSERAARRWALATAGALLLLAALLTVPRAWISAFFHPLGQRPGGEPAVAAQVLRILPPPAIEIVPERAPRPDRPSPPWPEPDWWRAAWSDHLRAGTALVLAPAAAESLPALSATPSLAELLARPDSSLVLILARLRAGDRREFERVRGMLAGATHARRWQSILDQAARVHGEFPDGVEATPLPPPPQPR